MEKSSVDRLIGYADKVRKNARVPKSGFRVGAALLTKGGKIITGTNMELQKMFDGICAERAALVKAVSEGYNEFEAIAIVSDNEIPVSPCGTCRQALIDFGSEIKVIMSDCRGENIRIMTTAELLPFAFERTDKFKVG